MRVALATLFLGSFFGPGFGVEKCYFFSNYFWRFLVYQLNRKSIEALLRPLSAKPVLVTCRDPKIGSKIGPGLAAHVLACTHSHKDVVARIAAAAYTTDLL